MSLDDHRTLLSVIRGVKGKVMISGYPHELYDMELSDWHRHDFPIPNHAATSTTKRLMTECVWCNYQ